MRGDKASVRDAGRAQAGKVGLKYRGTSPNRGHTPTQQERALR